MKSLAALLALAALPALAGEDNGEDHGEAARQIAAEVPATDIWLIALRDGALGDRPITVAAQPGYQNQPAFSDDGRTILYTSIGADGQSDIYRYDRRERQSVQLTRTPESEYSPTPRPRGGFSVVRVEADGAQQLWVYDAGGAPQRRLLEGVDNVGYHAWLSESEVAAFLVAEPPELRLFSIGSGGVGQARDIATDIGRSLKPAPDGVALAYTRPRAGGGVELMLYEPDENASRSLGAGAGPGEDFAWTSDGQLIMAEDRGLRIRLAAGGEWRELADLSAQLPGPISRLAIAPAGDWLAFVAAEAPASPAQ